MVGIKERKKEIMGDWKNKFIAKTPSPLVQAVGNYAILRPDPKKEKRNKLKPAKSYRPKPTANIPKAESTKVIVKNP